MINKVEPGSLDGCDENTVIATKAEMQSLIFQRMNWNALDNDGQIQNFKNFVAHAVAVVCDAIPEFVIPVEIDSVREVPCAGRRSSMMH